jgi:hypothetical protein
MMQHTQIVVKCPECVEVRVSPADVTLRLCEDTEAWTYRFTCPVCCRPSVSPTQEQVARDAIAAGAGLEKWRLPSELLEHPDGPPITLVELFEFREHLLEPDWFDELTHSSDGDCQ